MTSLSADGRPDMGLSSLWAATAEPGLDFPPLTDKETADVVVVGGGYTGLSAALHLAEQGIRVVLLEAREPGWGASGRNGGQVISGLKYDPPGLLAKYGPDLGPRLTEFVGNAPRLVFDLIDRHEIRCEARRSGWIQPAHNAAMEATLQRRAESWAALGADVDILDRARVAELLGTNAYLSGWLDRRAGCLNPLSYARGLAKAAARAGARLYARSPAVRLERGSKGFMLSTRDGRVEADQLILATNGYTDHLWPGLAESIIPAHSFQVATAPLSDNIRRTILPQGHVSSDSRRVLLYFRLNSEGRLVMGGVGSVREPQDRTTFRHLVKAIRYLFPQVSAPFDFHWYGRVAVTRDFLPHLHEPVPGLHMALGYNGRGVAMATAFGSLLARRIAGESATSLPFPTTPVDRIPLHGLRYLYVAAARTYYRLRDIAA